MCQIMIHFTFSTSAQSREWIRAVVNDPGPGGRFRHTTIVVGSNSSSSVVDWQFGGARGQHDYNDTWSFDISTRKWTELQCTGSIPSPRYCHTAVLVDDVMYVFAGFSTDEGYLNDLYALQLSTQRWFKFHNEGLSPHRRANHAMASDGTRVFVLGGYSKRSRSDETSLIHVFDTTEITEDIKYPDPERNVVNPNEKTTLLAQKSSPGPPTQEQPQHQKSSSSEAASEANAVEAARRAGSELREYVDDQRLKWTSLVKERDVELVDMQIGQHERELASVRAKLEAKIRIGGVRLRLVDAEKLEAKESELEAVRLRLTDAEKGLTKSKAEADTLRSQTATGSMNRDEDQVTRRLMERMRLSKPKLRQSGGTRKA
ncbi:hypothetical protein BGY98DRAFT_1166476 [Russula aff. rugulosa BPL654]|nr:hypothetical protein BGY98DRAFT_1166476 [Russula aff. rugulosa BPL654]